MTNTPTPIRQWKQQNAQTGEAGNRECLEVLLEN